MSIDHHVAFEKHFYSVPWELISRELELRAIRNTIEYLHKGEQVATDVISTCDALPR